jgi:hypothetical protein
METHIPKGDFDSPAPCWIPLVEGDDHRPCKPAIKCKCGMVTGIGLHHVHPDGKVTASFYHDKPQPEACGWHVFLILDNWTGQFFPEK